MPSTKRPEALQAFLDAVRRGFEDTSSDSETRGCLSRVFGALEKLASGREADPVRVPTAALLGQALKPACQPESKFENLANRILHLDPLLSWKRRAGDAPHASPSYADGHANAMVVGPGGLEERRDVWVGLSLLAPDVRYPDHRHAPEEIYLVLSDGQFRQGERAWFTPGIGGTLYNEPNILHAMASSPSTPFLAVWCLFDARYELAAHEGRSAGPGASSGTSPSIARSRPRRSG